MGVPKDPRKAAIEKVNAEYGAAIREAKFAYDAAVRAALAKKSEGLQNIVRRLEPLPRETPEKEAG